MNKPDNIKDLEMEGSSPSWPVGAEHEWKQAVKRWIDRAKEREREWAEQVTKDQSRIDQLRRDRWEIEVVYDNLAKVNPSAGTDYAPMR